LACRSILSVFEQHAAISPDRIAFRMLDDGEHESARASFAELRTEVARVAFCLKDAKAAGQTVLVLTQQNITFIQAFLGCLAAGCIAVPAAPPRPSRSITGVLAVARDAGVRHVLFDQSTAWIASVAPPGEDLARAQWISVPAALQCPALTSPLGPESPDDVAFLQYTSGSTGSPKGVVVSHGNLVDNEEVVRVAFGHGADTVFVGWLPFFHDMGLIGNLLQPLYLGVTSTLMPPAAFIQRPIRWLRAIDRYRATTSGAPDFAYRLCVQKIAPEAVSDLDLRSWRVAFNGSEPVKGDTIEKFSAAFAPAGFDARAMFPCYGLAENTLFACGGRAGRNPVVNRFDVDAIGRGVAAQSGAGQPLVSVGHAWCGHRITIADPESRRLPEGRVGEILIAGGSVARGYWGKPKETDETFGVMVQGEPEARYLRTGDLGFIFEGELYIAGRIKDVIIIRGRNYYPQDIEQAVAGAASDGHVDGTRLSAFSVHEQEIPKIVVVAELTRRGLREGAFEELASRILDQVLPELDIEIHDIGFVPPGSLPITTSGKPQRQLCRSRYIAGTLPFAWRSRSPVRAGQTV